VNSGSEVFFCPYCSHLDTTTEFLTINQSEYIKAYLEKIIYAFHEKIDIEIDLDDIITNLSNNKSPIVYSEQRQQSSYECKVCKTKYDILGEFGCCPGCGKLNTFEVFNQKLNRLLKRLNNTILENESETHKSECADVLKNCITEFEAMAKDISDELQRIPATPKRKKDIKNLNFQKITEANENLIKWVDIDFLMGVSSEDKIFINRCYHKRHILTHNAGIADEKYIKNTADNNVRLNQKIYVEKDEALKLIYLMRIIAKKLFCGFESIS
jgi:hypothetical protein